ncbi:MAG: hypothetical protein HQ564_10050 [Candidatus Saganbacteria bacterium]|nr:hypothetical protein [Candidatus Saganbacteria bacterium]
MVRRRARMSGMGKVRSFGGKGAEHAEMGDPWIKQGNGAPIDQLINPLNKMRRDLEAVDRKLNTSLRRMKRR